MKKIIYTIGTLLLISSVQAQQAGTITNPPNGGTTSPNFWSRAGNVATGNHINNIFGTRWNSPIYFITDGTTGSSTGTNAYRMKLNGKFNIGSQYPINGYTSFNGVNTTGYLLLGKSLGNIYGANKGAFSLLHLNGPGAFVQSNGYRPWMKTGITFTGNDDNSYVGLRSVGNQLDETEMVINWSDNAGSSFPGPDALQFRFTAGNGSSVLSNLTTPDDLDGLGIARFTPNGNVGFGPTFGNAAVYPALYVSPQSLLQLSRDQQKATFLQITNQNGTGQTANDGLRLGLNSGANPNGYLRWQENTPFIFQTDWNNTPGGIGNGERMRLMTIPSSIAAPPGYSGNKNLTRVAISEDGSQPITQPRALLHLGYNTGRGAFFPTNDGWRPWMNIGTFTSNGTDNMYVGMKREAGGIPAIDRNDAIIGWGDNDGFIPSKGPDNLRFVFTATQTIFQSYFDSPDHNADGLEVARMVPGRATTLTGGNYGMMGIGNFSPSGPNTALADRVNAKLDIDGDLRIRTITEDSTLTHVLVADPADHNRVHWIPASELGGTGTITANNGATINPTGNVQWGQVNSGTGALNGGELIHETEIPLNNFNVYFSDPSTYTPTDNHIQVGSNSTSTASNIFIQHTKLIAINDKNFTTLPDFKIGGYFATDPSATSTFSIPIVADIFQYAYTGSPLRVGVVGIGREPVPGAYAKCVGVDAGAYSAGPINVGVNAKCYGSASKNMAGYFYAASSSATSSNYGIYASATGGIGLNYAGYFDGDVFITGNGYVNGGTPITSDLMFKQNVDTIPNALSIIKRLQPKTFRFDTVGYPRMRFSSKKQYGFIAQQVDTVLPELVANSTFPAQYDSLGNQISAAINFKALKETEFIAILTKGMQQQQDSIQQLKKQVNVKDSIDSAQDSAIANLNTRLTHLENCLQSVLPIFCAMSGGNQRSTNDSSGSNNADIDSLMHIINVQLGNGDAVILDQNAPNPFKEHTSISYHIPQYVHAAQIVFSDMAGNIIKIVHIHEPGNGTLKVYGADLNAGTYVYSIIVDGKLMKTRQMVHLR